MRGSGAAAPDRAKNGVFCKTVMKTEIAIFNPLEYLQSDEEIAQYLNNAYQDDDPEVFMIALGYVAMQTWRQEMKNHPFANMSKADILAQLRQTREEIYEEEYGHRDEFFTKEHP